jgi:putative hydrolase of the HAD superfamily
MSGDGIRAVFFDAVGTLIHPEPDAATVYAHTGRRFGSRLGINAIRPAFARAFARQEELDRQQGWKTDETRELKRWRSIVAEVLCDVADGEGCFAALYQHFGQAANWRCDPSAGTVVAELMRRGYKVGIASNFDHRLREVLQGMPELAAIQAVIISSEIGWRKPASAFFAALAEVCHVVRSEVLYVGDDLVNDYEGALGAGCRALLLTPRGLPRHADGGAGPLVDVLEAL